MILYNYVKARQHYSFILFYIFIFIICSFEIGVISFIFGTLHIFIMNNRVVKNL